MNGKQIAALGLVAFAALVFAVSTDGVRFTTARGISSGAAQSASTSSVSRVQARTALFSHAGSITAHRAVVQRTMPQAASSSAATSSQAAPIPLPSVRIVIADPGGSSTISVALKPGADACSVLSEAKAEGKLVSLTLDDSYKSTFGSTYVREINGYSNDWTFAIDGKEPEGCSFFKPKAGETIVWTFGGGT